MKPIPAIIEPAQIDIDAIRKHLHVEFAGERDDVRNAERHEAAAQSARESAKQRRLRIGGLLAKARIAWPERGPKAKGWGDFLREFGISEDSALRYIAEARGDLPQQPTPAGNTPVGDRDLKPANVNGNGGSGDPLRGTYCTPAKWAAAVGPWDFDPFSNPRSHIVATTSCQLERGDNGLLDPGYPGAYLIAGTGDRTEPFDITSDAAILAAVNRGRHRATESTRVWIQPPYEIVEQAITHYGHTRFCALLRFDPSTDWFAMLWPLTAVIAVPLDERLEFEAPPGIETSANPYPHAFYYADERDVTPAIRELCIVLRVEHPKGGDVPLPRGQPA